MGVVGVGVGGRCIRYLKLSRVALAAVLQVSQLRSDRVVFSVLPYQLQYAYGSAPSGGPPSSPIVPVRFGGQGSFAGRPLSGVYRRGGLLSLGQ